MTSSDNIPLDPVPDYDASDELEFGISWLPWILRAFTRRPAIHRSRRKLAPGC
ncbi:hypothetical protein I552_2540 [Mycobacterium xenopi 3993]|nr:hypothetical protein I552_2540 [Mycobacterium xenopi 3993]